MFLKFIYLSARMCLEHIFCITHGFRNVFCVGFRTSASVYDEIFRDNISQLYCCLFLQGLTPYMLSGLLVPSLIFVHNDYI